MKKLATMLLGAALSIILGAAAANAQAVTALDTQAAGELAAINADLAADDFHAPADTAKDNRVLTNKFWSNWSINGAIGTQFYYGENDKYMKFGERLTFPALDFYLNKWATPVFGWGLAVSGFRMKGIYQPENAYAAFQTKDFYLRRDGQDYYWQKGNFVNPFLYFTLDLISCFGGYNPKRIYDLDLYAGGGIAIGFDSQFNRTAPTFNAGIINRFRLTQNLGLLVNLRGALVGDDFEGESRGQEPLTHEYIRKNIPLDGIFGVTLGLSWRFGERKDFTKAAKLQQALDNQVKEIEQLAQEKAEGLDREKALAAEADKARMELLTLLDKLENQPDPVKDLNFRYHINFDLDKINLTNREIIDLQYIAEVMKLDETKPYYLIGYADQQTGSVSRNQWLSENRVNAVYDVLTGKYGISPDQLHKSFEGGVDTMFLEDHTLSRCVVIYSLPQNEQK